MIQTPNTIKAQQQLEKLSGYPIITTTLDEIADRLGDNHIRTYLGVYFFDGQHHVIGINSNKPETNESSFVHECIHGILNYEGYPTVKYAKSYLPQGDKGVIERLRDNLQSAIQHPAVYYRMSSDYTLDMDAYYSSLLHQKTNRLSKKPRIFQSEFEKVLIDQQDIIDGHEYFYYDIKTQSEILKLFESESYNAYKTLVEFQNYRYDFISLNNCKDSSNKLLSCLKEFGEKHLGSRELTNRFWNRMYIDQAEKSTKF